jgi:hypothetical protein
MAPLRKTLAVDHGFYLVSRPHDAADAAIELVDDPLAGQRYTLLLRAADQHGLNRLPAPEVPEGPLPRAPGAPLTQDGRLLEHLRSNPVFWLLHEPAVLREEGYTNSRDDAWYVETEAGRAMHALIYEIRALECRLIGHGEPVVYQRSVYDRVTVDVSRSVPLMEFPSVFRRQTAPTVPGFEAPLPLETERVGDLMLATNFRGYDHPDGTWAVLLDRRDHALVLLSGGASADGIAEVEEFRCLWNLECPPASEMVADAEARFAAERT